MLNLANNYNLIQSNPRLIQPLFYKKDISFKAKQYPSGNYSEWFVEEVKSKMHLSKSEFDTYVEQNLEKYKSERKRARWDIIFAGSMTHKDVTTRRVDYIELRADLINEKLNREAVEAQKIKLEALRKTKLEQQKFEIKEKQLKPKFCDLVQREKEGKPASIPNCVMIAGSNPEINRELIEWTGKNSNCHFVQIKHADNLLAILKEAESRHEETGNRTLIHVDGFDQLLDHKVTPEKKMDSLKSIMSSISENYHSTIIFSTTKPEKLDQIALQPHRVERINANINDEPVKVETPKEIPTIIGQIKSEKETWSYDKPPYSSERNFLQSIYIPQRRPTRM